MLKHITATALLALALAVPAAGQTTTRKPEQPNRPRTLMQHRIRAGVHAGQISKEELAAIRQHLQQFREHMRTMRSDGSVTPEERRALKQQWRQISRQVFRARHRG